jgi:hypothetical protein
MHYEDLMLWNLRGLCMSVSEFVCAESPRHIRSCPLARRDLYYTKEHYNVPAVCLELLVLLHPVGCLQRCQVPLTATATHRAVTFRPHSPSPSRYLRTCSRYPELGCWTTGRCARSKQAVISRGITSPHNLKLALGGRLRSQNKPTPMSG